MPVTNPAILSQIHLSGESVCPQFRPHPLKANFCTACSKLVSKHSPEAILDDNQLLAALEFSQKHEKVPSCILARGEGSSAKTGGLYHGGFKAVMNTDFLRKEGVTHIVNTAKGLEIFGPKYREAVERAKLQLGIVFLELDWEDTTSFIISDADLTKCVKFIHSAITSGGSVLVHCAQGKSRSATAVTAYIMASREMGFEESLQLVQAQRKMAEPNPTFTARLKQFEKSDALKQLRSKLD